jgi:hypothetical protein
MASSFEIRPHEGVGPIALNSLQSAVRDAMTSAGFPLEATHGRSDYFCKSAVQVEYTDGRATFIGVNSTNAFIAIYRGMDVFDVTAQELFAHIAAADNTGPHHFSEYEHYFPGQVMALWDADTQYDRRGNYNRIVWAQVGLGSAVYAANRKRDA